jgi:threonine dehydratase
MPVSFADIESAAERISGIANVTPVMTSSTFNERFGCDAHFKCESFQKAGAFKFRGAYNALSRLTDEERARGVLTFSSGNHGQALALAGKLLGSHVTVVMPTDAPALKRAATEGYGAEIIAYDRDETTREALGRKIADEKGLTIIPPYDHPHIVAGQGTTAAEFIEQAGPFEVMLAPCGGGGLLSGVSIATKTLNPNCRVIGVEPETADDAVQSFEQGRIISVHNPDTVADGARTPSLSPLTYECITRHVDQMVRVPDSAILEAMRFCWDRMKLVVEPTGALAMSAIWDGKIDVQDKRVGVIISGGNVDIAAASRLLP